MDIKQLKYILVLARHKSLSEAAYEISLSQSSLSKNLVQIESELGGVLLFDRSTRPVKLTDAGKEFICYAQRMVDDFEALKLAMGKYQIMHQAHLVIGSIPVIARLGLTTLIVSFQKKHPQISVEIKERPSAELLHLLKRKEIDVAFITVPDDDFYNKHPLFTYYTLLEDEIFLVVNQSHKFAQRVSIDLAEAKKEVFILLDSYTGIYNICMDAFQTAGFTPQIYEIRNVETIMELVSEGLGVTLLTGRLARSFERPNITMVHLNQPFKRATAIVVWNQPQLAFPVKMFVEQSLEWAALNN
ncbi:MAG: LysR family transcriptional regulator [Firmicutes bacterium]|nr:LysR family transcriptional regulator [Bacillota bacterium]